MKKYSPTLTVKIWLAITASILITVVFSFMLSNLFYQKLYVENVEDALLAEGNRLALDYEGGPLSDEIRKNVEWYNSKNESEVFVVSNPRELSACLPFEIDYETLIQPQEREQLLNGEAIKKMGYEERFDREIMAVIIPLLDQNRLEGIIYLYVPLAKISELTKDFTYLWYIAGLLFMVISFYIGTILVRKLTKPLKQMTDAANRVSQGDYSARVFIHSADEVGQLASAFNHMSSSIQKEDERRKQFLANVSHELRTPLSYVKGYSEALLSGIAKSKEDKEKYMSIIARESKRMDRLVGDLLDLSRLEADEFKLEKIPLPFAQLVEDSTQKYNITMNEKGLKLSYDLDPDIIILGDEGRIEQVIQNIMDNALRYTEKGGISITLKKFRGGCSLSIEDTGTGIPKEDLDHITDRFYRVNKARTRANGGTGLGLAISKKIITLHGGSLNIESDWGKGTKVEVILPIVQMKE